MQSVLALAAIVPAALAQTLYGCYTEIPTRALTGAVPLIDYEGMTVADCEAHCTGFDLWGLEYGGECYCGNSLAQGSFPAFSTDCTMPCPGDTTLTSICGGPNRLSLYGTSATAPESLPYPHDPPVTTTQYAGCYTEVTVGERALAGASGFSLTAMTVPGCGGYCRDSGFTWFGLEYSAECYCGSELSVNSTLAAEEDCAMPCSGASTEVCGGSNRLSVYQWV
ncbi:WSC domain-containing protein [Chaetomium tenue]|uniref:WSC domain-containing protein n=1 Tax=Chaetomium tenue TaxID=1854479 RepID=A0ACB7P0K4_9PEZI|nr:WSC domain-containing protein [Chaetomium globosum]